MHSRLPEQNAAVLWQSGGMTPSRALGRGGHKRTVDIQRIVQLLVDRVGAARSAYKRVGGGMIDKPPGQDVIRIVDPEAGDVEVLRCCELERSPLKQC